MLFCKFPDAEFELLYGEGISKIGAIIDLAAKYEIIEKSGAWYNYNEERLGQGKENARLFLKQNPALCDEIDAKVRAKAQQLAQEEQF